MLLVMGIIIVVAVVTMYCGLSNTPFFNDSSGQYPNMSMRNPRNKFKKD